MKMIKNEKLKKAVLSALAVCICLGILGAAAVFALNAYVKSSTAERIISSDTASDIEDADCILVLGCLVRGDGSPSHMLSDRIDTGISLYKAGAAPKILMSGDHGRENYDEVGTMKDIAVLSGISSSDVFEDHAGFSTYESLYRAKEIFGVKKAIIVTQEYHLYRAIYIAESLGIEAFGVPADLRTYSGQTTREVREILARIKDFGMSVIKPEPTYLGEFIPISGNGDLTEG